MSGGLFHTRLVEDYEANTAYLYLVDGVALGESKFTLKTSDEQIIVDFDKNGRILGIEFLDLTLLPIRARRIKKPSIFTNFLRWFWGED